MATKTSADHSAEAVQEIEFYARPLKAPRIREAATRLAEQARQASWTHEEYLAAVLSREVSARDASGAELRIRASGFPARKSLEDFNLQHQPALRPETLAHLGTAAFIFAARNLVLLGPPGTGTTHVSLGLGIKAAHAGHRVLFATATDLRLGPDHPTCQISKEGCTLVRWAPPRPCSVVASSDREGQDRCGGSPGPRGSQHARVAAARKMLEVAFCVLGDGQPAAWPPRPRLRPPRDQQAHQRHLVSEEDVA